MMFQSIEFAYRGWNFKEFLQQNERDRLWIIKKKIEKEVETAVMTASKARVFTALVQVFLMEFI